MCPGSAGEGTLAGWRGEGWGTGAGKVNVQLEVEAEPSWCPGASGQSTAPQRTRDGGSVVLTQEHPCPCQGLEQNDL